MTNYEKWVSKDSETSRMSTNRLPTGSAGWRGLHTGGCQSSSKVLSPGVSLEEGDSGHSTVAATQAGRCICMLVQSKLRVNWFLRMKASFPRNPFPRSYYHHHLWGSCFLSHWGRGDNTQSATRLKALPSQWLCYWSRPDWRLWRWPGSGLWPATSPLSPAIRGPLSLWHSHVRATPGLRLLLPTGSILSSASNPAHSTRLNL